MKIIVFVSLLCLAAVAHGRRYHDDFEDMEDMMMGDSGKGGNLVSVNFDSACGTMINNLARRQIQSTFQYIAIATFFRRHDVDIIGMSLMFNAWARQKINKAKDLMMYLVKRGETVEFQDISKPAATAWTDPADALKLAVGIERSIAEDVNALAQHAREHNDQHLLSFIDNELVNFQADNIFEAAAYITKLSRGGNKFGLLAINSQMVKKYKDFVDCKSDTERYRWNY